MSALVVLCVAASTLALVLGVVVAWVVRVHRRQTARLEAAIDALAADVRAARSQQQPEVSNELVLPGEPPPAPRTLGDVSWTPEGRSVVVPTTAQVVDATLGRPMVRAGVLVHGLRRALRPEHRDRIRSLMRREFGRRRKLRQRAGRRAARLAVVRDQTAPHDFRVPGREVAS